jgi:DNA invertase Pin-like site-specific DNA recombinase
LEHRAILPIRHGREFEADLIRARTREGMKVAKAKGACAASGPNSVDPGSPPGRALHRAGRYTSAELAELFGVARSTVYRALQRAGTDAPAADAA